MPPTSYSWVLLRRLPSRSRGSHRNRAAPLHPTSASCLSLGPAERQLLILWAGQSEKSTGLTSCSAPVAPLLQGGHRNAVARG